MSAELINPALAMLLQALRDAEVPARAEERCDVCDEPIGRQGEGAESFALGGHGLYVWTRGDEVRYEEPPLCASCGTAIGVMALAQWSVEEEEG